MKNRKLDSAATLIMLASLVGVGIGCNQGVDNVRFHQKKTRNIGAIDVTGMGPNILAVNESGGAYSVQTSHSGQTSTPPHVGRAALIVVSQEDQWITVWNGGAHKKITREQLGLKKA